MGKLTDVQIKNIQMAKGCFYTSPNPENTSDILIDLQRNKHTMHRFRKTASTLLYEQGYETEHIEKIKLLKISM